MPSFRSPFPLPFVVASAVVVVVLSGAEVVRAQPATPVQLRFETRGDVTACPPEQRLRDEVKERLGYDPFARAARREVWVRIEPGGADVVIARIALSKRGIPAGTRELRSSRARCDELFEAVALSLSIAVDPLYGLRPPSSPTPSSPSSPSSSASSSASPGETLEPETSPSVSAGDVPAPFPAAQQRRRRVIASEWQPPPKPLLDDNSRLVFELGSGAVVGLGAGPGSVLTASVGVGARSGLLSLHLEAFAEAPGEVSVGDVSHVSGGVYGVSFQPCLRLWAGHLLMGRAAWAGGCGLVSAGGFLAGSEGLDDARLAVLPWVGLGGRATLDVALMPWLALRLLGDVIAPLTRIQLTDSRSGARLWASPMVSLRGGLLLVVFFT